MKKIFLLTTIIGSFLISAQAQLANTKWHGTIKIAARNGSLVPMETTWDFHQDTLYVIYTAGALPTDVSAYSEDNNKVISVHKVSGGVPCELSDIGKYSYEIKNDQLFITKISDACAVRGAADISQSFDRVK